MTPDLQALFPGQDVTVKGETITIRPFDFVTLMTKVSKLARSFAGSLTSGTILDIIADGGEDLVKIVKLAVAKPEAWWADVPADEGVELTAAVLKSNADFFTQRMSGALERITQALGVTPTGAPSSPDSSAPDTTGALSSATA